MLSFFIFIVETKHNKTANSYCEKQVTRKQTALENKRLSNALN